MENDLDRFIEAQALVWDDAMAELRTGRKLSHWMWFVFPQLRGLGRSDTSWVFGIDGAAEARAYLAHPDLHDRLLEALAAALSSGERDPVAIFGHPDAGKLKSCLTLFAETAISPEPFEAALDAFFGGARDPRTLDMLART